mmetsp:Transcript_11642/g.41546  ORF Transcript_11642/g.41546 Transcript_11642/m.41546 type:complete len:457 (-) Transcript_11642:1179-2549(-)
MEPRDGLSVGRHQPLGPAPAAAAGQGQEAPAQVHEGERGEERGAAGGLVGPRNGGHSFPRAEGPSARGSEPMRASNGQNSALSLPVGRISHPSCQTAACQGQISMTLRKLELAPEASLQLGPAPPPSQGRDARLPLPMSCAHGPRTHPFLVVHSKRHPQVQRDHAPPAPVVPRGLGTQPAPAPALGNGVREGDDSVALPDGGKAGVQGGNPMPLTLPPIPMQDQGGKAALQTLRARKANGQVERGAQPELVPGVRPPGTEEGAGRRAGPQGGGPRHEGGLPHAPPGPRPPGPQAAVRNDQVPSSQRFEDDLFRSLSPNSVLPPHGRGSCLRHPGEELGGVGLQHSVAAAANSAITKPSQGRPAPESRDVRLRLPNPRRQLPPCSDEVTPRVQHLCSTAACPMAHRRLAEPARLPMPLCQTAPQAQGRRSGASMMLPLDCSGLAAALLAVCCERQQR